MTLLWILVGIGIYYFFIKKGDNSCIFQGKKSEAEEILKLRLINGEITEQEYEKLKMIINK